MLEATAAQDLMPMYPDTAVVIDTLRGNIICSREYIQRIWVIRSDSLVDSLGLATIADSLNGIDDLERIAEDSLNFWPPTDPEHTFQTQFFNTAYNIDLPRAWQYSFGDSRIRVAIVDHGVDYEHADLGGGFGTGMTVVDGYDFTDNDSDPEPWRFWFNGVEHFEQHGTPIAGIIAGSSNNGEGIAGIAGGYNSEPDLGVSLLSFRVVNEAESSRDDRLMGLNGADIVKAIWHASSSEFDADIINCSFSSDRSSQFGVTGLAWISKYQVYHNAFLNNALVIAGRGNQGNDDVIYPARFAEVGILMAISGLDNNGNLRNESSFGNVSMSAPWTTGRTTINNWVGDGYRDFTGTSNATPVVSGVAALIMSSLRNRDIPILPEDVMQILYASADRTGLTGYSQDLGWGRLDAGQALHLSNEPFLLEHYNANESRTVTSDSPTQPEAIGFLSDLNIYGISEIRKVTASFTLPDKYTDLDSVWVWVNANTNGLPWQHPSGDIGGGHVESQNGRVWTFSTYVYELNDVLGSSGWYPVHPDDVVIKISVLGKSHECINSNIEVKDQIIDYYQYHTGDHITVGPNVSIELPGNAQFHASTNTHFKPGFHAESLSRMHAFIAPLDCPAGKAVPLHTREEELQPSLTIFPNPSTNSITVQIVPPIQMDEVGALSIIDQLGKPVKAVDIYQLSPQNGQIFVDVSDLPAAAYYVRAQLQNEIFVQPFIKLTE
ncbi:MAG: S8 family peptidase [Chlorobi bacterium]|nr:S8 family peptidase [Chlorobiota bacterium]